MNEARPYSLQISMSMVVLASMYRLSLGFPDERAEARWILILCAGTVFLAASGMLAMLWEGAYLAAALLSTSFQRLHSIFTRMRVCWLLTILLLLTIGCYYLWTLSEGARATAIAPTNIGNLFFILYELFGFSPVLDRAGIKSVPQG